MEKILLSLLYTLFFCTGAFAQTVNGIPIEEIETPYARIVGTSKLLSSKVNIELEFGQHNSVWNAKDTYVTDENGNRLTLNSMVDALNFMDEFGYEFIQAYVLSVGNQNVHHYLMKKKTEQEQTN